MKIASRAQLIEVGRPVRRFWLRMHIYIFYDKMPFSVLFRKRSNEVHGKTGVGTRLWLLVEVNLRMGETAVNPRKQTHGGLILRCHILSSFILFLESAD